MTFCLLWWFDLKASRNEVLFAIALCAMALSPREVSAELSFSISTDLRGSISFLGDIYQPNSLTPSDGNQSTNGTQPPTSSGSSSDDTIEQFDVLPALHLSYSRVLAEQRTLSFGFHGAFSYVNLSARYPDGFTILSSGKNISFTEPAAFTLKSFDLSLGPYVQWELTKNLQVNAAILLVNQRVVLSSRLGSWDLEDRIKRSFFEWSASMEYTPFGSLAGGRLRPALLLSVVERPRETTFSLGLKFAFE